MCVCVCVCVCARACVRACVRVWRDGEGGSASYIHKGENSPVLFRMAYCRHIYAFYHVRVLQAIWVAGLQKRGKKSLKKLLLSNPI